jgi:malonate-semialdehyde dehydrogenase (acetylating)/methylmalonate-semialdehyde dehydrogenase
MVVMPDADIAGAADALMGAAYGSAGERCMAVPVAVAVATAGDALVDALTRRIETLRLGPGSDAAAEMGPLISAAHRDRVAGYIDAGVREGAELVIDGRGVRLQGYENGFFLGATLFDRVRPQMRIYREEIFGPVLCVVRAETLAEALHVTNGHAFGNGAAVFTRDGAAARAFASGVEAGMVGINVAIPVPMAFHSFGGWKQSLFGDQAVHGMEGVRFYTRLKTVSSRWPDGVAPAPASGFAMPTLG